MSQPPNMTDVPENPPEQVRRRRQQRLNSLIGVVAAFLALVVVLLVTDDSNGTSATRAVEMPSVDGGASFWSTAPAPAPPAKQSASAKPINAANPAQPGRPGPRRPSRKAPAQHKAPILFAGVPGISTTLPGAHSSAPAAGSEYRLGNRRRSSEGEHQDRPSA